MSESCSVVVGTLPLDLGADPANHIFFILLKTLRLCAGADSNLGDRILGEVLIEKHSFMALPGKGRDNGLVPFKNCTSQPGRICEEFLVLLLGKSQGQRSLVGCSPWSLKESDSTERLHFHFIH